METKICPKCGQEKSSDDFFDVAPYKGRTARKYWCCKKCCAAAQRVRYRKRVQRDPLHAYEQKLKVFGLTRDQYLAKADAQHNLCAICGRPETVTYRDCAAPKLLSVDHNHITGQNRDLLCTKCNTFIGMCEEDVTRLQAAIDYLRSHGLVWSEQNEQKK